MAIPPSRAAEDDKPAPSGISPPKTRSNPFI